MGDMTPAQCKRDIGKGGYDFTSLVGITTDIE